MPRFFLAPEEVRGETAVLRGEDARHIMGALRMHSGDELTVCDGAGRDYPAEILPGADGRQVPVRLGPPRPCRGEMPVEIALYLALSKGEKMDFVVQKAVELGVGRIVPVVTRYCVSRPDSAGCEKKRQRWQKIARQAAMQSGRGRIPAIDPVAPLDRALAACQEEVRLFCYEQERGRTLRQALQGRRPGSVALLTGAEGGFSPEEAQAITGAGFCAVSLGPRILRCETAPLCALSALSYEYEQL